MPALQRQLRRSARVGNFGKFRETAHLQEFSKSATTRTPFVAEAHTKASNLHGRAAPLRREKRNLFARIPASRSERHKIFFADRDFVLQNVARVAPRQRSARRVKPKGRQEEEEDQKNFFRAMTRPSPRPPH